MKTLFLSALLLLAAVSVKAQATNVVAVTNLNIDLVWSQATEDALRIAYKIDENLRTNGIPPYTNVVSQVTYKVFISELLSGYAEVHAPEIAAQNEARFIAVFRTLQTTNTAAYNRIYRIAFNKGTQ